MEHFLKRPATTKQEDAVRKKVAAIGFQAFLQMAVMDNFVHGDLHPGNMIVRGTGAAETVQAVVLDAGIVIALAPSDRRNFVTLFAAVAKTDGRKAAYLMVDNAREHEWYYLFLFIIICLGVVVDDVLCGYVGMSDIFCRLVD